jgi:hypothetical protein
MRLVTSPNFCSVCLEGLWLALARRVSLIEDIEVGPCASSGTRTLRIFLVPLAEQREGMPIPGERYIVKWFKDGEYLPEWDDLITVQIASYEVGTFAVQVTFSTLEVREDPRGYLNAHGEVTVGQECH